MSMRDRLRGTDLRPPRRASALALALAGAFAFGSAGCGASDLSKQVDTLKTEITSLRASNAALAERVDALEIQAGGLTRPGSAPAAGGAGSTGGAGPSDGTPDLRVVKLTPSEQPSPGDEIDPDDTRVKIRSTSGGVVSEDAGAGGGAAGDSPASLADFKRAKELYSNKKYDDAITSLSSFVARYPDSAKAAEATYLRGMAYVQRGDHKEAATQFERLTASYPKSDLVPDALYELMKAREKLGENDAADRAKARLKKEFPKSSAAKKLSPPSGEKKK